MTGLAREYERPADNSASRRYHESRILNLIKAKVDADAYRAWIHPLKISEKDGKIILLAASRFNMDFIKTTFGHILDNVAKEIGCPIELSFQRANLRVIKRPANINEQAESSVTADAFDGFVCSEANQFALSALKKCAAGKVSFSPLVIYGATGSGKSALVEILANAMMKRVVKITGAQFVSDFIRAMQNNVIFAFKDAMRNCDLFIMDDVQSLAGKRASAEEFQFLLSDLIRMEKNVVITSNIAPSRITGFDKSLVSLLSSGLSVDLVQPDVFVREKILSKAGIDSMAAKAMATRIPANGHILAGVSKKISAWRELECGDLSESVLEKLLGDVLQKQNTPIVMVRNMCARLGVSFDAIMSKTRTKSCVFARQKIMAALKMSTDLTLAEIGRLVGDRDHASVIYAMSQIERAKHTDMLLESEICALAECDM